MIVSLTGFMGCGKSSVGRELSALTGCRWTDLDTYIEEREGRSIHDIFSSEGELPFRDMELTALQELTSSSEDGTLILSLGGGTLMTLACADLVHNRTECIYLRAGINTLVANLLNDAASRPLLYGVSDSEALRERISDLMSARSAIYEVTAHHILDIDGLGPGDIARRAAETLHLDLRK